MTDALSGFLDDKYLEPIVEELLQDTRLKKSIEMTARSAKRKEMILEDYVKGIVALALYYYH